MSLSNEKLTRPSSSPTHLTVTKILPLLPRIWSTQRLKQIFTHSSMSARPRSGFEFEAPHADPMYDNEGLAHIGDGVLSLAVTDLIQSRYPRLHVGPTSKMRDRIKCGGTLARITVQYGLHERLRGENPRLKNEQRVQGMATRPTWVDCSRNKASMSSRGGWTSCLNPSSTLHTGLSASTIWSTQYQRHPLPRLPRPLRLNG
ncbi:hypothetical protein H4582DRAFT_1240781 [Lactarius indigo]|nr:hypothetical protein H4582DRAFT_1240781 [Lactarius indigo]